MAMHGPETIIIIKTDLIDLVASFSGWVNETALKASARG
jgi:hypothetical protein